MAKRITLYGIFTCLALIFGYIESLFSLSFIAPGIKIGLANCICLLLTTRGDIRGALLVNITRVTLSALLFSTPFALLFSLSAGVISTLAAFALSRFKAVTAVGYGIGGAAVHNIVQIAVAALIFGGGVVYYLPFMLIAAAISRIYFSSSMLIISGPCSTNSPVSAAFFSVNEETPFSFLRLSYIKNGTGADEWVIVSSGVGWSGIISMR